MTTIAQAQAQVEALTRQALEAEGCAGVPADTISDAVDIYLGRVERDTGATINRAAIDPQSVAHAVEAAVSFLRSLEVTDHIPCPVGSKIRAR